MMDFADVKLGNGNHRLTVFLQEGDRIGSEIYAHHDTAARREVTAEEVERYAVFKALGNGLVWRCRYYDEEILQEEGDLKNHLILNEDSMKQMGAGPGESIWTTANQMELWEKEAKAAALATGTPITSWEAMNHAYRQYIRSPFYNATVAGVKSVQASAEAVLKSQIGA
ncbi:hypothetical protein RhiLY_04909 [Ceratobasidium sp. AG-Ba]|nr:hypothetical protein RhiLY_04909 [Ceratobasidium sp. AG-Ba]